MSFGASPNPPLRFGCGAQIVRTLDEHGMGLHKYAIAQNSKRLITFLRFNSLVVHFEEDRTFIF